MNDEKALEQAEKLYSFIGKYVVSFQWIESKIDEMFHLSDQNENFDKRRSWLARKRFSDKCKSLKDLVLRDYPFRTKSLEGWNDKFVSVIGRIELENERRNSILHSGYLFEFLSIGGPIIQTHIKKETMENNGHKFNQYYLTEEKQFEILSELYSISVDFGFCCTQLRFSYKPEQPS